MTNFFTINSKMKKSMKGKGIKIVNFTLPAFRSKDGFVTCPNASKCATACYARTAFYMFKNVSNKHHANLTATQSPLFIPLAIAELQKKKPTYVRIHDAGDFYSLEYFYSWIAIAKALPDIKFYAYSKQVQMIKENQDKIPENLIIIFSFGGKQDNLIDKENDRHSFVFEHLDELWSKGYIDASSDDLNAIGDIKKIGLIYHHPKAFENTGWKNVK